ncbi:transcriptional regulator [Klebsiella variicola]|uniref:helix-turn-helix domain-containing protein n=1 Tax=Klebsiella variicola TaxID=244366 RepID=UPI0021814B3E|nr:helix-turn-helix transcriptional regulator [Klebsiella variicola]GKJ53241.1 transcriptional regulator [Klebsiella variicola]HDU5937095.1 helix-turn-helix transcriptional regulator [Klebsiella variicola]
MSSERGKKLKAIREAEGLSQAAFSELTGINIGVIKNYEYGRQNPGISVIDRIIETQDFEKYTLWLMTGKTNEASGQIAPTLSPSGPESTSSHRNAKKVG